MSRKSKRSLSLVFMTFLFLSLTGFAQAWTLYDSRDGIQVFREEVEGSPLLAFRGETIIEAPLSKVASILVDTSRYMEWIDKIKDLRLLSPQSSKHFTCYLEIGTPPLVTNRDFVIDYTTHVRSDGSFVMEMKSGSDALEPNTGFVRAKLFNSAYTLTRLGPNQTKIVAEIHTDPKGFLPTYVVNLFQKDWPYNTLTALKKIVSGHVNENAEIIDALKRSP